MHLLLKRFFATIIDYGIIVTYASLLFLISNQVLSLSSLELSNNPIIGQLIGFTTLTLPVLIFSYLTEKSIWRGTVGKKVMRLNVSTDLINKNSSILVRNILKYLPWEIAHTGVHWIIYYSSNGLDTPLWIWVLLILPQFLFIAYFISIVFSKGESSLYDKFANTKISRLNLNHKG